MLPLVTSPVAQALAWSLVHFLWQGAAIAALAFVVQRFGGLAAGGRYITGVVAMAAMLAAPIATFTYLNASAAPELPLIQSVVPGPVTPVDVGLADTSSLLSVTSVPAAPPSLWTLAPAAMLVIWGVGVIVLSMRLFGGWLVARRLTRHSSIPAREEIQVLARRVAARLALDRIVRVCESTAVVVPVMIGWMKPVVLLPATALAGLSVEQVEALLAHELAHVRRHDYLVNLLQSAIETLLFYHPAVWWVSSRVRTERELCCDDIAVGICDRVVYATALTDLAAMASTPRLALAATDGPLLRRVRRILGQSAERAESGSGWLIACAVVLLVGTVTPAAVTPAKDKDTPPLVVHQIAQPVQAAAAQAQDLPPAKKEKEKQKEKPREVRPEPVQTPTEQAQTEQARAAEKAAQQNIEDALRQLARERADNEAQRAILQGQARVAILQSEMDLVKQQLARAQQQVQTGMASQSAIIEAEAKLRETQQKLNVERAELEYQQRERQLRQREIELGVARKADDAAMTRADLEKMLEALSRQVAQQKEEVAPSLAVAANETAQAGDTLVVVIQSEPDLPKAFVIQSDGTIRFPFVGPIKVLGMTAAQAREAVTKQLTDRKLATGSGIEVTLRRPRSGGR